LASKIREMQAIVNSVTPEEIERSKRMEEKPRSENNAS